MNAPSRLTMTGIRKAFGPTAALQGVDLDLRPGEVHALVGENGAGKSTLMKVLSGAVEPDAGTMTLDGAPYAPRDPLDARRRGVAMVYQELTLAPHLTVEANVMLGQEPARFGVVRGAELRRRVAAALAVLEHPEIRPESPVEGLSPAAQQLVEIARRLWSDVRVLVLDEPTSSLARDDAHRLFALVRRLRDRGVAVVYISHFLEEVAGGRGPVYRVTGRARGRDRADRGIPPGPDHRADGGPAADGTIPQRAAHSRANRSWN